MFVDAIEKVDDFTRPILSIIRNYKEENVYPGSATMFFVNDNGCAITCKHVAETIINADKINNKYMEFKMKMANIPNDKNRKNQIKKLEKEYEYHKGITVNLKNLFLNSFDSLGEITIHLSEKYDIAIIQFKKYQQKFYKSHAVFIKDSSKIKQGMQLCRLGYPFPEFNNFCYNRDKDDIEWTDSGNLNTPKFPIDGIVTRQIMGAENKITGIELSTPGLRGQSGGPLFDSEGKIYGMQSATNHLYLGFDMENEKINVYGNEKIINNQPFLHVGQCVHVDIIKDFLREKNIEFFEE